MEEKTIEIMCDAKNHYLMETEKGPVIKQELEGVIEELCSYSEPIKLKFRSRMSKTNRYVLEKIADLHNRLYYAKEAVDNVVKRFESGD